MHGMDRVTHTHTKQIPLERLVKVKCTDGSVLFCSDGHEFFTNRGWIRARYLQNTDSLYTSISGNVVSNKTTPDKEVLHGADEEVLSWAQIEKEYVERQKEAGTAGIVGVDYIEIYQQGSNNEHFSSVVGNKECVCGTITLYDLSVETHPSFYANGIMVHNCHKMTNDAQNGLLKALEDTPAHVYFILATTEPEKLLKTIRGRCSQFQVNILDDAQMFKLLRHVVKSEGAKLSKNIYEQIIEDSLGHCRDALQILEQVLNADPDKRLAIAKRAAELQSQTIELCRALMGNAPWKKVASILQGLKTQDPESIRRAVLGYCNAVLLKGTNNQAAIIMEEFIEPFYNTGFPGLTFACYSIVNGE
jgi:DNA polymerase III delta prime subunit